MKTSKKYTAVFAAHIDLKSQISGMRSGDVDLPLRPGESYSLKNRRSVEYGEIVGKLITIIDGELKSELQKYTDLVVEDVKVQSIYEGSIEIVFTVTLSFLELIGGLKDLYDAIFITNQMSKKYIDKRLKDEYGDFFVVGLRTLSPKENNLSYTGETFTDKNKESNSSGRDAFFYYLVIANIILFAIVCVLVFGAVNTVYF